ncbi:septal ring lytic transglycosylase RlpA family protein [Pontibacter sp. KCTC 32443]|uniref:septal ring lytic transglycosylase RlpA family protein n=1 Tax=Pontibacter TaxID=323449 RepID=UPI00164D9E29|nr:MULTISPECIES: septal ring lytic transglycosylase RlpA family protein [Pontibacter]MBC5775703.1 septal ring lytic transglycosylase RlpA family protein [Pontibacter sp. KCTC 32443]
MPFRITRAQHFLFSILTLFISLSLFSCAGSKADFGERGYTEQGKASYYSRKLQGRKMANGEPYRRHKLTAAHKTLPMGTKVKITNTATNKSVKVKITDRGPFVRGRIVDLSESAAKRVGLIQAGVAPVTMKVIRPAARN